MIDSITDSNEDLEKTQRLPVLTADLQLDEALRRERAARTEIVELLRQNLRQAEEIEQLRGSNTGARSPQVHKVVHTIEQNVSTEERLFEVCGALKDTLSKVLKECRTRRLALKCENAARRALDDSCHKLEQILSAPGFSAATACHEDMEQDVPLTKASQTAELAFLSMTVRPGKALAAAHDNRPARVPHLEILGSDAKPLNP
jgi:hypothetical protein